MAKNRTPLEWQRDPNQVQSDHVQFWSNGVMVTTQMSCSDAQDLVWTGRAFVINSQAIGALVDGKMSS